MIKVLNIISDTNIGGAGRVLLNYLGCADRTAFAPSVALPRGSALAGPVRALDVPVHELDGLADRSLAWGAVPALCRVIGEVQPDLVQTHGAMTGRVAARLKGRKTVYTKHCAFPPGKLLGSPPGRLANRVLDRLLSDGVIAIGQSAREVLVQTGIPEGKIHTFYNGVAPLPERTAARVQEARRQYGFGPEDFVLGMLARLEPYKGPGLLLDAAELLRKEGRDVKVLFAGTGSAEPELRRRAAAFPPGTVVFAGFVEEVERPLWAMDVQVNASTESETSSLSLLEGMSMGLPAIASDVGGNPILIEDGCSGLVFPTGDAQALARAAARIMDAPSLWERLSRCAGERYRERYTSEAMARNMEETYRRVLKGGQ